MNWINVCQGSEQATNKNAKLIARAFASIQFEAFFSPFLFQFFVSTIFYCHLFFTAKSFFSVPHSSETDFVMNQNSIPPPLGDSNNALSSVLRKESNSSSCSKASSRLESIFGAVRRVKRSNSNSSGKENFQGSVSSISIF